MKKELIEKFEILMTTAFGLVAALAWNSAIQQAFRSIFGEQSNLSAMFIYAIIVTIFVVVITLIVGRISSKINKKSK